MLEGGQDKDDQKRDEIFYHEIIAAEQINRMLAPKVFTNAKRYTEDGVEENITFNEDDNLIIKGNNLIALVSLLHVYENKIKCIYVDPPYNTGNDGFNYNDSFNHSTWLIFMKNRLEISKRLLKDDGIIFVQCDDNEQAYLKVLMDEVFGRDNFYGQIIQLKGTTQNDSKKIQKNHEYILVYVKKNLPLLLTYKNLTKKKIYQENYYLGRDTGASSGHDKLVDRNNLGYTIYFYEGTGNGVTGNNNKLVDRNNLGYNSFKSFNKNGKIIYAIAINDYDVSNLTINSKEEEIYSNDEYLISLGYVPIRPPKRNDVLGCWTWGLDTFKKYWNNDEVLIKNNKNVIKKEYVDKNNVVEENGELFYYIQNQLPIKSVIEVGNTLGTKHLKKMFNKQVFSNPKSEELLHSLLESCTSKNDIVLDFHLGSGTTAAVAHKMGRKYIGIEQMDYIKDVTIERMRKVIEAEQGGISKSVNWQGGGSFVYCELLENASHLIKEIQESTNLDELKEKIYSNDKIIPYVSSNELEKIDSEFQKLNIKDKKKALISLVDKNKLYVNYSDIEDQTYCVNTNDKNFTHSFYKNN